MDVASTDIAGGSTRGVGTVRRCLCHFLDENKANNYSSDDDIVLPGGKGDTTLRCSACVQHLLRTSLQRHRQALRDHANAKEECARELGNLPRNRIPELQAESRRLRDRSNALRKECGEMAVKVAQAALENDTIRETMAMNSSPVERQRLDLQRLEQNLLEGSMSRAIDTATRQVRFLRFQWARKVFAMHRLQIDTEDIKLTPLQKRRQESQPGQQLQRRARGIAKISGLPLPNAGPELYGVLPPRELQSALRIVATVTSTVARCLGIVLPHRILLTFNNSTSAVGDITDTISNEDLQQRNFARKDQAPTGFRNTPNFHQDSSFFNRSSQPVGANHGGGYGASRFSSGNNNTQSSSVISSSTASLYSMMDTSYFYNKAKKALAKATGQQTTATNFGSGKNATLRSGMAANSNNSKTIERSFDATIVAQRLTHATAAILTDVDTTADASTSNNSASSKFALSSKAMHQGDDFAIALQLLQNDVITLCIRAGVPVSKLWPAEAMLLNLHELEKFCQRQTSVEF
mmetsp:Transcript_3394/g.8071  ORF Transcript_3394/g.8071 Transcript_3394/m.8071 type:complete len:521 (+) Transcript_3394:109-1671(+)|eukprot:CAMPEP_0116100254 /NCGR_PEP_ID=MMETSP0327-20121206/12198_1 /TAXON_ID=44447 /ORGANISM="Pseudo-nitzschia delicatissima, Strain B596" /LENGTH=520 /DNA_ID=CAMNT_0003592175 /DNA_START=46 /DNA_END=1608 /DNA_ORIENTATION=+